MDLIRAVRRAHLSGAMGRAAAGLANSLAAAVAVLLTGCMSEPPPAAPSATPVESRALIRRLLPDYVKDREGWVTDIYASFAVEGLDVTQPNACAVMAVIEQESSFRVNPAIPGLGAMAWKEIDTRADHAGVPRLLVHGALQVISRTGRSYSDRIDAAKTEKDLSDIYEDFIGSVPLGKRLFEDRNPVRTRGPMQVNVAFASQYSGIRPYPYPAKGSVSDELFTRRGGLYFGIAHLLAYPASYDRYLYRFADFNAGQYSSRNAAFQAAVSVISGIPLTRDGALLPRDNSAKGAGSTEMALRAVAPRLHLSEREIHSALEEERTREFERTQLYRAVFDLADRTSRSPLPRAVVPRIDLHGPKISRKLTTAWYAERVNGRFERCERK
jgi:hypothetical protein